MAYSYKKPKAMGRKAYKKKKSSKKINFLPHDKAKTEKKYKDQAHVGYATDTGYIQVCNGIGQGTGASERVGNRINLKSINYSLTLSDDVTALDDVLRIMVVYDKDCDNSALPLVVGGPTTPSILDSTTGAPCSYPLNLQNKDRYVVLSDKKYDWNQNAVHSLGVSGATGAYERIPMVKHYDKWKSIDSFTQYNGSASTISGINSGAIYLIGLSEYPQSTGFAKVLAGTTRLRYTDA